MKKSALILLFVATVALLGFTACKQSGGGGGSYSSEDPNTCEHIFIALASDGYLKSAATCTQAAEYYEQCTVCGEKGDVFVFGEALGHTGGTASCESKAVCTRCGESYGELAEHTFGEFVVTKEATCTERGTMTAECSVCGETQTQTIEPSHKGEWYIVAEPRCFDDGEKQRVCTVCDELEEQVIPAYGSHDLKEATCVGGRVCRRCKYTEGTGAGHVYGEWKPVSTNTATCEEDGTEERSCKICGAWDTRKVYRTGHKGSWTVVQNATCTQEGEEERTCTVCNRHETRVVPQLAHTGEWTVKRAATCTTNGEKTRTCTVCGKTESLPIMGMHDYGEWVIEKQPTCSVKGLRKRRCNVCGEEFTDTVQTTAHQGEWQVLVEATCTEDGVKRMVCSTCGQTFNDKISKLGHNLQGGSCTTPAQCTRCDYKVSSDHEYGEWQVVEVPDCERYGYDVHKCIKCGETEERKTEPTGHTLGEWSVRKQSTCLEFGRERRICTECNKAFDRTTGKGEHSFGEWIEDVAATCVTSGEKYNICTVCGEKNTSEISALGHNFADGSCYEHRKCTRCDETTYWHVYGEEGCDNCGLKYSEATYTLSSDETYYIFSNSSSVSSDVVFIRKTYNGKPVKSLRFGGCGGTVILPDSFDEIANQAFLDSSLTKIFIPLSVKRIGRAAFMRCNKLTEIDIPSGVKEVGESAFYSCVNLKKVVVSSSVEEIGDFVFYSCENLSEVVISDGVKTIGEGAFMECKKLTNIALPESVTSIGNRVFSSCEMLTSVNIPENVANIGERLFEYCSELTQVTVSAENKNYDSRNDCNAIIETATNTLIAGCKNTIVPDSATIIGAKAFWGIEKLTSIVIPESVKRIEESAFYLCCDLAEVTFNYGLEYVGRLSFDATKLTNLVLPNSVEVIDEYAFSDVELASVYIPSSVTKIYSGVFDWSVGKIVVDEGNKVYDSRDNCNGIIEIATNKLILACKNTVIPESVKIIGAYAFSGCSSAWIKIPNTITSFEKYAFGTSYFSPVLILPHNEELLINFYKARDPMVHYKNLYIESTYEEFETLQKTNDGINAYYYYKTDQKAGLYLYSEEKPENTEFKYWHYVDGEPTAW